MTTKEIDNALYRLSPDIAAILGMVAKEKHFSEAMVLEMLIRKEAIAMGIIDADHPETAFLDLINTIKGWGIPAHEDFTLEVFERVESTPDVLRLWKQAVTPLPGRRGNASLAGSCNGPGSRRISSAPMFTWRRYAAASRDAPRREATGCRIRRRWSAARNGCAGRSCCWSRTW